MTETNQAWLGVIMLCGSFMCGMVFMGVVENAGNNARISSMNVILKPGWIDAKRDQGFILPDNTSHFQTSKDGVLHVIHDRAVNPLLTANTGIGTFKKHVIFIGDSYPATKICFGNLCSTRARIKYLIEHDDQAVNAALDKWAISKFMEGK